MSSVLHMAVQCWHLHEWFLHLLPTLIISYQVDEQQVSVVRIQMPLLSLEHGDG